MPVIRVLFPAVVAVALLFAAVVYPSETFMVAGSAVLTLSTASSIIFFVFVIMAALFGFERTSGRHLTPAEPIHLHRTLRDEMSA